MTTDLDLINAALETKPENKPAADIAASLPPVTGNDDLDLINSALAVNSDKKTPSAASNFDDKSKSTEDENKSRTWTDLGKHELGVAGRATAHGLATASAFVPDMIVSGMNYEGDKLNKDYPGKVNIPQLPTPSSGFDQYLTKLGVPQPENLAERLGSAALTAGTGGAMLGPSAIPGAIAGASAQGAAEMGASPTTQLALGALAAGGKETVEEPISAAKIKANNIVLKALQADQIAPADIAQRLAEGLGSGRPHVALDFMHNEENGVTTQGRNSQALAAVGARLPGPGASVAAQVASRTDPAAQADRIGSALAQHLSPDNFYDVSGQALKDMATNAPPAYEKAFQSGPITSNRIQDLLEQPEIQQGIGRGLKIQRIEAAANGTKFDPNDYAVTGIEQPTRMNTIMKAIINADPSIKDMGAPIIEGVPNMRLLDAGKKGLDAMIENEKNPVTGKMTEMGRALTKLKTAYVGELDNVNPDYAAARQAYADPASRLTALNNGRSFDTYDPEEIQNFFQNPKTSDAEKQAYLTGVKRAIQDKITNPKDKSLALEKIVNTDKLRPMFPDDKSYQSFLGDVGTIRKMQTTDNLSRGQSATMPLTAAKDDITAEANSPALNIARKGVNTFFNWKRALAGGALDMLDKGVKNDAANLTSQTAHEMMKTLYSGNPGEFLDLQREAERRGLNFNGGIGSSQAPKQNMVFRNVAKAATQKGMVPLVARAARGVPAGILGINAVNTTSPGPQTAPITAPAPLGPQTQAAPQAPLVPPAFTNMPPDHQDAVMALQQKIAQAESGGNPNAQNPKSSAFGKYQFTVPTWRSLVYKYGKQSGITMKDRFDPGAQEKMMPYLMRDNAQILQKNLRRAPTDGDIYAAHVLGAGDSTSLIRAVAKEPNMPAAQLVSPDVVERNRAIFFKDGKPNTAEQVYTILNNKVSG